MDINVYRIEPVPPTIEQVVLYLTEDEAKTLGNFMGQLSYNHISNVLETSDESVYAVQVVTNRLYTLLRKDKVI